MILQTTKLSFDYNNMMSGAIGPKGISEAELNALEPEIQSALAAMRDKRLYWRDLPTNQDQAVSDIIACAEELKSRFDSFVLLGIGGSALGPMAVQQAINHPFYNELSKEARNGWPKLYIADNSDPERLNYLFDILDLDRTVFNVVSKSGSTSETMSQFMIIKEKLEKLFGKEGARQRIIATTDPENGNLRRIVNEEGYRSFPVPAEVGGRFSELCPVGLLPAAFCGINIRELLRGAAHMDALCSGGDYRQNPALMYALLNHCAMSKGHNISVLMPYADRLKYMAAWYAQLWAESLGKRFDRAGNVISSGQTPVAALGATDQHSQVQLYTEGPDDKAVTFIGVDEYRETMEIPKLYSDMPSLGFLGGRTQNELIRAELKATEYALTKAGKMNMTITLEKVDEFSVGQLIALFELATAYAGELLNINAFDQPGVEEGKNAVYAMFGRPGYDAKKAELDAAPAKERKYVI